MTLDIGIHDIPAFDYHKDPAPEPSLSSSLAKLLLNRSPAHAWRMHPRLGNRMDVGMSASGDAGSAKRKMEIGSAVHALALERDWDAVVFIDAADYRGKAAKDARSAANDAGKTPILEKDRFLVEGMAAVLEKGGYFHPNYLYEETLVWKDWETNGAWCRARVDSFSKEHNAIIDLKTTGAMATPEEWGRTRIWGYAMQCGFYRRGIQALGKYIWGADEAKFEEPPRFIFVVQETDPPYLVRRFEFDSAGYHYADMLADRAIRQWAYCMHNNKWDGYPSGLHTVHTPIWIQREMEGA